MRKVISASRSHGKTLLNLTAPIQEIRKMRVKSIITQGDYILAKYIPFTLL